jgi:hypothetical protein
MGNRERSAIFCQSLWDFPCPVTLDKIKPSFGLHRYKQGLQFVPTDDEGFALRGDKQRLVYKGRRRSHRFTILGDTAFEYDCILNKEPVSNVITLLIEGAENFDFFRQPDTVKDPSLAGSYAVYKKETLVGEGTGKLCHIHRPEIIDARGRRCWGELSIAGNCLCIAIPENWLAEAKYPVIVDPIVGTTTVGSLYLLNSAALKYEGNIPVSRFQLSEGLSGLCTGYFYTNQDHASASGHAVIYSDLSSSPNSCLTKSEATIDLRVVSGSPAGWRSGNFTMNGAAAGNSYIWFGLFPKTVWYPRYDSGSSCTAGTYSGSTRPSTYPSTSGWQNVRLSMYFTYSYSFTRTLTQGVTLSDAKATEVGFRRNAVEITNANDTFAKLQNIIKVINDSLSSFDLAARTLSVLTSIKDTLSSFELSKASFLHFRNIHENLNATDALYHIRNIIRGIVDDVGMESEAKTGFLHFRTISETAQAISYVIRGMVYFAHIVTRVFVRDYFLNRFLKAKAELSIKSCVCREIVLEGKIVEK